MTGEPVDGWYPVNVAGIDGWVSGRYVEAATDSHTGNKGRRRDAYPGGRTDT